MRRCDGPVRERELDMGLSSTSAQTRDLGLRGTFGAADELGATTLGAFYQTKLSQSDDNLIQTTATSFASPTIRPTPMPPVPSGI